MRLGAASFGRPGVWVATGHDCVRRSIFEAVRAPGTRATPMIRSVFFERRGVAGGHRLNSLRTGSFCRLGACSCKVGHRRMLVPRSWAFTGVAAAFLSGPGSGLSLPFPTGERRPGSRALVEAPGGEDRRVNRLFYMSPGSSS